MCALYEYDIMKSTGKLRFARGTPEDLIYQGHPPESSQKNNRDTFPAISVNDSKNTTVGDHVVIGNP
jgi:hypothetical protein